MTISRRAALFMLAFAGLWAVVELIGVQAAGRYSLFQVVWMRYAVHLLLMFAIWGWRDPKSLWTTRRPVFQLTRSLLMLAMPASFAIGLKVGLPSEVLMSIFWLSPMMILLLAVIFLRERPPLTIWLLTVLAWLATILLYEPQLGQGRRALLLPFVMAFTFALYVVMTRSLRDETGHANLFYTALGVFLTLTPVMPAVWVTPTPADLIVFVGIGTLGYVALLALDRMAAAAPVSISAPFVFMQVVFTVALGEAEGLVRMRTHIVLGALLILAIAGLLWWRSPVPKVRQSA